MKMLDQFVYVQERVIEKLLREDVKMKNLIDELDFECICEFYYLGGMSSNIR